MEHIAEVPNSGKVLLYWLFRSKIWYFRVIWLFTAKFFKKFDFFYAFWRAAVKNQNKTIQLDFCQIRSYLAVLGTVYYSKLLMHCQLLLIFKAFGFGWVCSLYIPCFVVDKPGFGRVRSSIFLDQVKGLTCLWIFEGV